CSYVVYVFQLLEAFVLLFSILYCLLFFFFSSRRRHTRFKCDWSSDVCSSDLDAETPLGPEDVVRLATAAQLQGQDEEAAALLQRSEERRVGKECRDRRGQ